VAIIDLTGRIVAASVPTDEGTDVSYREYFLQPKGTGNAYISDPGYSVITKKPAMFFSAPVKDAQGHVLAVVRSRVNLAAIWNVVEADGGSVGAGAHSVRPPKARGTARRSKARSSDRSRRSMPRRPRSCRRIGALARSPRSSSWSIRCRACRAFWAA